MCKKTLRIIKKIPQKRQIETQEPNKHKKTQKFKTQNGDSMAMLGFLGLNTPQRCSNLKRTKCGTCVYLDKLISISAGLRALRTGTL